MKVTVSSLEDISRVARQAIAKHDWRALDQCVQAATAVSPEDSETWFLRGFLHKIKSEPRLAKSAFENSLEINAERHDCMVELAGILLMSRENQRALSLLQQAKPLIQSSPLYLDAAATHYANLGLPREALPLYRRALELQPGVPLFLANLAACLVFVGQTEEAEEIYKSLLTSNPSHQRQHYQLSRLQRAHEESHLKRMLAMLPANFEADSGFVFLLYAIGKELEDLGRSSEAFLYFERAGNAIKKSMEYNVLDDIAIIEKVLEQSSNQNFVVENEQPPIDKTPIFVVGLPRTGTTLIEQILISHPEIISVGETDAIEFVLRELSEVNTQERMSTEILDALSSKPISSTLRSRYLELNSHLLTGKASFFIEKLPYNYLYLNRILDAFPEAKIIFLDRHPLDACYAMFKQPFTWAYKFSYSLQDLEKYYRAFHRLRLQWQSVLRDRMFSIKYEDLVTDPETLTKSLCDYLGVQYQQEMLTFYEADQTSMTASSVQVRSGINSNSVGSWRKVAQELESIKPLTELHG